MLDALRSPQMGRKFGRKFRQITEGSMGSSMAEPRSEGWPKLSVEEWLVRLRRDLDEQRDAEQD